MKKKKQPKKRDYEREIEQAFRDGWNAAVKHMREVMPSPTTIKAPKFS